MTISKLAPWKRAILLAVGLLALAGLYDALSNLPVVSGCAFYQNCPRDLPPDPLEADGRAAEFR